MKDKVDISKVEKQIKKIPKVIIKKFFDWINLIESEGYLKYLKVRSYKDHTLKGHRKGQRAARLGLYYRIIYEVQKDYKVYIIKVEKVTKHDYR